MTPRLILTGMMGTGKSTVGRKLAHQLGWRFVDTDAVVVARAGKSIERIFAEEGEKHFRALEREAIRKVADDARRCAQCGGPRPAVISTGGGAILDEANLGAMRRAGVVVCLTARPEVIARREAGNAGHRPKLMDGQKPLEARVRELMASRAAAYAKADFSVDTSDIEIEKAAQEVLAGFAARARSRCIPSR